MGRRRKEGNKEPHPWTKLTKHPTSWWRACEKCRVTTNHFGSCPFPFQFSYWCSSTSLEKPYQTSKNLGDSERFKTEPRGSLWRFEGVVSGDLNHLTIRGWNSAIFYHLFEGWRKKVQPEHFPPKAAATNFERHFALSTAESYCLLLFHCVAGDFLGKNGYHQHLITNDSRSPRNQSFSAWESTRSD